ncbi:MAG: TIGR03986 family CRISPR-associated RAMP protein [Pseudanabaena sp. M158S2SP1A06QC]|nr:TIGR03986 family CRISPR-associated RAMP protein [Pseudanabaena sp. M158S2SP1A06QC]
MTNKLPKHINPVPKDRKVISTPYNFVELPDEVLKVSEKDLPAFDQYHASQLHTGKIECVITTESPLYIRCGLISSDFDQFGELSTSIADLNRLDIDQRIRRTDFFNNPANLQPMIPGSSLRGMLRNIVEIASFSKISRVSDRQKFFFRAVAATAEDSLGEKYDKILGKAGANVKAGYLQRQPDNSWRIYPAKLIENKHSFVWIKESIALESGLGLVSVHDNDRYYPQCIDVRFDDIFSKNNRYFAGKVSKDCSEHQYQGFLVTSGNMMEGNTTGGRTDRKNHCLIGEKDTSQYFELDKNAVDDYCQSLTDFQKSFFDKDLGIFKESERPVFYCEPTIKGKSVSLFGHNPNFRVPYDPYRNGKAASALDFIPNELRDSQDLDIAESIFGWVRDSKQDKNQSRSGRIFISDAVHIHQTGGQNIWLKEDHQIRTIPKILASPKSTTFQHYLVQTDPKAKELKDYSNVPIKETVIRGHKLYWHKGDVDSGDIEETRTQEINDKSKQYTEIKPIKDGVSFEFSIYFENLSEVELGALLWVLDIAQEKQKRCHISGDQEYRFSLGMGKPLGMGAVKISHQLWLNERKIRYQKLFGSDGWETAYRNDTEIEAELFVNEFTAVVLAKFGNDSIDKLEELPRIKTLLKMLGWTGLSKGKTRYLEIEHSHNGNEYKERKVLPVPDQV